MSDMNPGELNVEELIRYSRHLVLPEVGEPGQRRLKAASVLLVGTGGLGSPLALYLAAAGVGRLALVEFDLVDPSNLQRQVLYNTPDIGRSKLEVARERILGLNPNVRVDLHPVRLTSENALEILQPHDVIAEGTDNFATRYLVNDACVLLGKPNVYGSVFRFEGQASVFDARTGPCYRCIFPEAPPPGSVPSCAEGGVLGVLPGVIGLLQATEVVKLIIGIGETLIGRLLVYDALRMEFRELRVRKNPDCPVCGEHPTIRRLLDYDDSCGVPQDGGPGVKPEGALEHHIGGTTAPPPVNARQPASAPLDPGVVDVSAADVKARLDRRERLVLLDVREAYERRLSSIPGAKWIPMGQILARLPELDRGSNLVVFCHVGIRSREVVELLRAGGYKHVWNLQGGIDAWARLVDPSMRRY